MSKDIILLIQDRLSLPLQSIKNTVKLLDDGATVPFISRYRKEMTGSLDEVAVENIKKTRKPPRLTMMLSHPSNTPA